MMFKEIKNQLVEIILEHEGGYVNDPDDPGGETKYGISKRAHPKEDIANLSRERAKEIYLSEYWQPWMEGISSQRMRLLVLDCAVNCGLLRSTRFLQSALGLVPDGVVGQKTMNAIWFHLTPEVVAEFARLVFVHYRIGNPKYHEAWFARLLDNLTRKL